MAVVVEDDEALHLDALAQDRAHQRRQAVRPGWQLGVVVVGDDAADRDPGLGVEQREDGVEDLAADVLVIDVDAVRAGLGQSFGEVRGMVVEAGIEAEHLHGVAAFSAPPATPTTRQPLSLPICPTVAPTGPVAAATTRVSPAWGLPMSSRPM